MFDTVKGKLEMGPYIPKPRTRDSWQTRSRDYFDPKLGVRMTSIMHTLSRPEARIAIYGDLGILSVEASLPKLLYGNNVAAVIDASEALQHLNEFVSAYVDGDIPDLNGMAYNRVDYCHNFQVGQSLPDYIHALSGVKFLKHRRTTDGYGGVEWWNKNGRTVRAYDKYKEILEQDRKDVPEARGILRFEVQHRKKSGLLPRRLQNKNLTFEDVLKPELAYSSLVETLNAMCLDLGFEPQDAARDILDQRFSYPKATRLLGLVRRLETESMERIRDLCGRSTFYSDKKELRALGLWPPSAGPVRLPALAMPPLETILSIEAARYSINTREANANALAI